MKAKPNNRLIAGFRALATLAALGALLLAGGPAAAGTVYWDTNYTNPGSGNNGGSWDAVNWNTDATGVATPALWVDGDRAIFSAGTDGTGSWTVNLDSTVSTPSITFKDATGDNSKTIAGTGTINIGGGVIDSSAFGTGDAGNNGRDVNMNVVLAGSGGLTIAAHGNATANSGGGGGSEFRLGAANTFSGGLSITSGLVSFNTDANLGDISNVITLNGGGILCTGSSHSTVRDIKVGASGGTIRTYGSTTLTLSGTISNAAGVASATLRRTDGGTLVIKTQGTGFTGTFHNGGGSTQLNAFNADWSTTDFVVDGGNLMPNGGGTAVVNSVNSTADVIINNGTTLDVDTGAITMRGAHWYKTTVDALGKLTSSSGTLTITNGAATGALTTTDHQIRVKITDSGATPVALVKNYNNSLALTQPNTYSGGTTINGGRINGDHNQCFGSGLVTVNSGGQAWLTRILYTNNFSITGIGPLEGTANDGALRYNGQSTTTGTVHVASAARIGARASGDFGTMAGPLTGSAALEKTGAGVISITGDASGYTGPATVSSGPLQIAGGVTLGASSVAVSTGATLINRGTLAGPLTVAAGGTVINKGLIPGALAVPGTASVTVDGTQGGDVAVEDTGILGGEGTINGALTLGSATPDTGAILKVDGSTAGSLAATGGLTLNGVTAVQLTGMPAVPGSPMDVVTYGGPLAMAGTADDAFELVNAATYRGVPVFADTGTAITLTIPGGADLTWVGGDAANPTFWDLATTANWQAGANLEVFFNGDNVLFDDSGMVKTLRLPDGTPENPVLLSPATVTFDNSAGNDYTIEGNAGEGFTGGTSIVKNGTGTATLLGYSHNYTGTVTVNAGVLKAGCYEMLGNSSGVTINDGGQFDVNGKDLGNMVRHYSFTIAGAGPDGMGAITNSNITRTVNERLGALNLALAADAAIGNNIGPSANPEYGRYDIGRSGPYFGSITGNGHTLTKVGTGMVTMRAPATDITYVINGGTVRFENFDSASGLNPITVNNGGRVEGYGWRVFPNTLELAAGATLGNGGGGTQIWTGPVNLSGGGTVNLSAASEVTILPNVISGDSSVNYNGNNTMRLTGSESNTYTGTSTLTNTDPELILAKTGGAVAIPGDMYMSATGTRAILSTVEDNQFGPTSVMRWTGTADSRLELKGTTQTLAGIDNTGATPGYNCIQHSEFGSPAQVDGVSDLILNVADGASFIYSGVIRDQGGKVNLTKTGPGTQTLLNTLIDYTGPTVVAEGKLIVNSDDMHTVLLEIAAGASVEVISDGTYNQFENQDAFTLSGAGTYIKSGTGIMSMGWDDPAYVAMASGGLIHIQNGTLRLEYGVRTFWTTNKSDMLIDAGATFDLWDNNINDATYPNAGVFVDSLDGAGSITRTNNVEGNITVGVDDGDGKFFGTISNAAGKTNFIKTGLGSQTLAGANTYTGNTTVNGGTLTLADTGSLKFALTDTASNQINGTGTVVLDGAFAIDSSALTVTAGSWTLVDTATLASCIYGATFSPGTGWTESADVWTLTEGSKIWTFTEATGVLDLVPGNTYWTWIDGFFPGETDPAIIGADADPDHDGIANGVEMVLGGNPKDGMDVALLPTIELVTDPAGLPAGNYILFTYRRTDGSVAAGVTTIGQYSVDLGTWLLAEAGGGVVILEDDNYTEFTPPATEDTDRVRIYVPQAFSPKLFGRLNVTVPAAPAVP